MASAVTERRAVAVLPMYDLPPLRAATDALWAFVATHLRAAGERDVPDALDRTLGHVASWQHPSLLLGQACEYPLAVRYGAAVQRLATPTYAVPGGGPGRYSSVIVVRRDEQARELGALRGRVCAINERDSNSGMNLLRAAIAPLAGGTCFFAAVIESGAHWSSARLVADGEADVAAIDCVTFAHLAVADPALVGRLRPLGFTPSSPALPFVTAAATPPVTVARLRAALQDAMRSPLLAEARRVLCLAGLEPSPEPAYETVRALERAARERGYPVLC